MTEFEGIIHQAPLGKGRPRAVSVGGRARVYTPTATADWEHFAAVELRSQYESSGPMTGPLGCEIVAVFPRTAELLRKVKSGYKHPTWRLWMPVRVDADNIAKAVLDAVEKAGIVQNDCQIADLHIRKEYALIGELAHVTVRLWSLT